MKRLLKKVICAFLCFSLFTAFPAFTAHAEDTYGAYGFTYNSSIVHLSVPVGAQLCFQTPPLKKTEKLYYTAGNGNVLHTFVAGKPIENSNGTIRYKLGYVCYKTGETGVYMNCDGKKQMLYSIQVVDDKSKLGFPLSTSFGQIFANQTIEKIVIADGSTFEKRQTTDSAQISRFLTKLAPERLYRDCHPVKRVGWRFGVDFYLKGQKGYYSYTPDYDLKKIDGFSIPLPTGNCVEKNAEEVWNIIGDFYTSLK